MIPLKIKQKERKLGEPLFKNPRNTASGSIKLLTQMK